MALRLLQSVPTASRGASSEGCRRAFGVSARTEAQRLYSHPGFTEEHEAFRAAVRSFVKSEVDPSIDNWERERMLPRALFKRAGDYGLLGLGFPEELGGTPADPFMRIVLNDELARAGSGGLVASLLSVGIGAPPIVLAGSQALNKKIVSPAISGDAILSLAITEPGGGSDVANMVTTAVLEGDHYIVNGEKTYITSGVQADFITMAVRTTQGAGAAGISILVLDGDAEGVTRTPLEKMGWHCSDTAAIHLKNVKVPVDRLVGRENEGFKVVMSNFNMERFSLASMATAFADVCWQEAHEWASERHTFGAPLTGHQAVRHMLVDMKTEVSATRAYLESCAACIHSGHMPVSDLCMLKNQATGMLESVASKAVQILGGMGYMQGTKSERIFRETKVLSIGGGTTEVLKDLAFKQLDRTLP